MGSKSLSKSVQIKFTSKGLFVGGKINKLIPIKSIEKIKIKSVKVDLQDEHFIEITSRIKSNSQQNKLIEDFRIENLTLSIAELSVIIDEFMEYKQRIGTEQK